MPPHCDSVDGPVVDAARRALDAGDVELVLPFVPAEAEHQVRETFENVVPVRLLGENARSVADLHFFETVVRLHRAGEGAPYTGLKPAGLPVGPVIPLAEQAIEAGSVTRLADFLARELRRELQGRLDDVRALAAARNGSVAQARRHVEAVLGLQVYAHHLFQALHAPAHEGADHHH